MVLKAIKTSWSGRSRGRCSSYLRPVLKGIKTSKDLYKGGYYISYLRPVLKGIKTSPLTDDQGEEMAQHQELAQRLNIRVYFADPHSPWQRPTNEGANGLLRQYLPKGTDLSGLSQRHLTMIAKRLNTPKKMPRLSYTRRGLACENQSVKRGRCTSKLKSPL